MQVVIGRRPVHASLFRRATILVVILHSFTAITRQTSHNLGISTAPELKLILLLDGTIIVMATSTTPSTSKLWHESFPAPQSTAEFISRETVLGMLRSDQRKSGHDFLIIDLRRSDHEVRTCLPVSCQLS